MDWDNLSLAEQLGNIGSELNRAQIWQDKGDVATSKKSLERAIGLVDLSLDIKHERPPVRKELARLREVICDLFAGTNHYPGSTKYTIAFCLSFAFLARK